MGRLRMDARTLQSWWFERQGLMEPKEGLSSAEVLAGTGWARSVGGANPYLTLFARAGISREAADRDLGSQEIHELPSARGCTYVVPRCDYALALTVGQGGGDDAQVATAKKFLGVTEEELERLSERARADGLENIHTVIADMREVPLEDETASVVVSSYAFHHLPAEGKELALAEARRILRPGGRLVVCDMMFSLSLARRDRRA